MGIKMFEWKLYSLCSSGNMRVFRPPRRETSTGRRDTAGPHIQRSPCYATVLSVGESVKTASNFRTNTERGSDLVRTTAEKS